MSFSFNGLDIFLIIIYSNYLREFPSKSKVGCLIKQKNIFITRQKLVNCEMKKEMSRKINLAYNMGSGCGSIGRAVALDTRGRQFESSHRHNIYIKQLLSTVFKRQR